MSATRMMILGVVQWLQPVHGYDVRRELLSWNADKWANVQPGSIYHALRKLTSEDLLREVTTEQVGARPARTTYEITAAGEAEFETLLRQSWWTMAPVVDPFMAAFSFLPALEREEAAAALRNRASQIQAGVDQMRSIVQKPPFVQWVFELSIDRAEVEVQWCHRIAARIENGDEYFLVKFDQSA